MMTAKHPPAKEEVAKHPPNDDQRNQTMQMKPSNGRNRSETPRSANDHNQAPAELPKERLKGGSTPNGPPSSDRVVEAFAKKHTSKRREMVQRMMPSRR